MATAAAMDLSEYENDPRLFLFTSLTAGSSHVITATSRMETILKANRIPFQAIDLATDEKARRLWQRRGQKKKLPGLVKDGFVLGDLEEVEEWNEFGELKENIGPVPASNAAPAGSSIQGISTAPPIGHNVPVSSTQPVHTLTRPIPPPSAEEGRIALPGAAEIAAMSKAKEEKEVAARAAAATAATATTATAAAAAAATTTAATDAKPSPETMTSAPVAKEEGIEIAKEATADKPAAGQAPEPTAAPAIATTAQEEAKPATAAATTVDAPLTAATTQDEDKPRPAEPTAAEPTPADPTPADTPSTAILSRQTSTDNAALSPAEQINPEKLTHRGSEVKEATPEEIKKLEEANTLHEADGEDENEGAGKGDAAEKAAVRGVQDLSIDAAKGEETTQEQEAKEGGDAGKSVED